MLPYALQAFINSVLAAFGLKEVVFKATDKVVKIGVADVPPAPVPVPPSEDEALIAHVVRVASESISKAASRKFNCVRCGCPPCTQFPLIWQTHRACLLSTALTPAPRALCITGITGRTPRQQQFTPHRSRYGQTPGSPSAQVRGLQEWEQGAFLSQVRSPQ